MADSWHVTHGITWIQIPWNPHFKSHQLIHWSPRLPSWIQRKKKTKKCAFCRWVLWRQLRMVRYLLGKTFLWTKLHLMYIYIYVCVFIKYLWTTHIHMYIIYIYIYMCVCVWFVSKWTKSRKTHTHTQVDTAYSIQHVEIPAYTCAWAFRQTPPEYLEAPSPALGFASNASLPFRQLVVNRKAPIKSMTLYCAKMIGIQFGQLSGKECGKPIKKTKPIKKPNAINIQKPSPNHHKWYKWVIASHGSPLRQPAFPAFPWFILRQSSVLL